MLAECRDRVQPRRPAGQRDRREQRAHRADRASRPRSSGPRAASCGCSSTSASSRRRAWAIRAAASRRRHLGAGEPAEDVVDHGVQRGPVRDPRAPVPNRGVGGQLGAAQHRLAERRPLPLVLDRRARPRRRRRRRTCRTARSRRGSVPVRGGGGSAVPAVYCSGIAHPLHERVEQADLEVRCRRRCARGRRARRGCRRTRTCRRRCRPPGCRSWPARPRCRSPTPARPRTGSAGRRPSRRGTGRPGRSRRSSR